MAFSFFLLSHDLDRCSLEGVFSWADDVYDDDTSFPFLVSVPINEDL